MDEQRELEDILYQYACGLVRPRHVYAVARKHGYSINLRRWIYNAVEAIDNRGITVWLEI